jgi:hypothetical protein
MGEIETGVTEGIVVAEVGVFRYEAGDLVSVIEGSWREDSTSMGW